MKGLHGAIPLAVLAATAHAQVQVIGGGGGTDVGNHASVPTENTAGTSVTEEYTDDHSLDFDHGLHVYPPGHGHYKRRSGPPTLIGGASGVDVGNSADIPFVNTFSSSVDEDYQDDHSVDFDATTIIKPPHEDHRGWGQKDHGDWGGEDHGDRGHGDHGDWGDEDHGDRGHGHHGDRGHGDHGDWGHGEQHGQRTRRNSGSASLIGGASGVDVGNNADISTLNEFGSSVAGSYTDDHSIDVDTDTIIKPGYWRRGNPSSIIDGSRGVDVGSGTSIPTVNKFSASYTGSYKDDHSIDIDATTIIKPGHPAHGFHHPMHHPRGEDPTLIAGPGGVDVGNSADIPTLNSFTSSVDEDYTDDHSVDFDSTFVFKPHHKARSVHPSLISGAGGIDTGNGFSEPTVNSFGTATSESVDDDHSVKINSHQVIAPEGHEHWGPPHYEGHGQP
ncbi:hypothetical protein BJX99DRAFT_257879 [Aspergillus californicus]